MIARFERSVLHGEFASPASKSIVHRLLICGAISGKPCIINNISFSDDINATIRCLSSIGAGITISQSSLIISSGIQKSSTIRKLYCGESAATLRFMIPLCTSVGGEFEFYGSKRLLEREHSEYASIFEKDGIVYKQYSDRIYLCGKLKGGEYTVNTDMSSQFLSGMLMALANINENSIVTQLGKIASEPYIDMTVHSLLYIGAHVTKNDNIYRINNVSEYQGFSLDAEGDYTLASVFDSFNYIGGDVTVKGLSPMSMQGDKKYSEYYQKIGKSFCTIDINDTPDLAPLLMVMGALFHGVKLTGTKRLAYKESSRGEIMCRLLEDFGVKAECTPDEITVESGRMVKPVSPIDPQNDHRIAMAASVLLSLVGGELLCAQCVNKSMPHFFDEMKRLGAVIEVSDKEDV